MTHKRELDLIFMSDKYPFFVIGFIPMKNDFEFKLEDNNSHRGSGSDISHDMTLVPMD